MKKLILGSLIILAGIFIMSCAKDVNCINGNGEMISETREIAAFHSVYSNGSAEIYISPAEENSVKIEAESNIMPRIKTEVADGRLNISTEGCINKLKKIKIYLGMKELRSAEMNGSGLIKTTETMSSVTNSNSLYINGSGDIDVASDAMQTEASINGSGNISLTGAAAVFNAIINGSGEMHSYNFICRKVNVSVTGSGDAEVFATEELFVKFNGSGDVYYKGNPAKVDAKYDGSGKLIKK